MESFHDKLQRLASQGKVRVSEHGYDELADDGLSAREVVSGLAAGVVIEEYPDFAKGPCALFLQEDAHGSPVHVVWGMPKGYDEPVVLVAAYRPDPQKWDRTYRKRLKP
ncbi:MAG: DUF4258 domain-containing protein [Haliea sp.]|nr:DUF4258 domain-containing protein [Haliea sp.]